MVMFLWASKFAWSSRAFFGLEADARRSVGTVAPYLVYMHRDLYNDLKLRE